MSNENLLDPQVLASLQNHDIQFDAMACEEEFADTAAFCEKYGYSSGQAANTILVAVKTNPVTIVACVVLATTKLDVNKKLRTQLDNKRASFASGDQTTELTGMKIGGVTVFGLPDDMKIFIDEAVLKQSEVVMGGGNRTSKVLLNPAQLLKLPLAIKVDMSVPR
jgi:prolyl-tRNA editing enzyme YbaK/EbsC (Cys-tRNA(Pro) deacylase)